MTEKKKSTKPESLVLPVVGKNGKKTGEEVTLHPEIFLARINKRLLDIVLTSYAANQRSGTASTKERKEVRGGGKKPWRQKGTGRARAGSSRSPLWRGGGTTFGPHPRDYSVHIPQEMKRQALLSALSLKVKEENLLIVDEFSVKQPKTKEVFSIVNSLKLGDVRTLCVIPSLDENLKRASGNIRELVKLKQVSDVNAYDVLRRKKLLFDKRALPLLEKRIFDAPQQSEGPKKKPSKEKVAV